jgi:hypothetical protein
MMVSMKSTTPVVAEVVEDHKASGVAASEAVEDTAEAARVVVIVDEAG